MGMGVFNEREKVVSLRSLAEVIFKRRGTCMKIPILRQENNVQETSEWRTRNISE